MQKSCLLQSRIVQTWLAAAGGVWLMKRALRQRRKLDLAGRTILITGSSRGLGLALGREFAMHGARVALCARDETELRAAEDDLRERGADVRSFACDLTDEQQASRLISDVESSFGPIDVLANNAGTIIVGPAETMALDDFREAMRVNFWAAVYTTLAVAPRMKARGSGRIVNIGSIGGKMPVPHLAPYCASKFALVGFSGALRTELAADGILVTTVNPGLMNTGSPRNAFFKGKHAAEYAWFSIGDALPGLSMSAETAARRIVTATVHGDAEVILGAPARLAALFYGIAPDLQLQLNTLINRALPASAPGGAHTQPGRASESWITRSYLRSRGQRAERELNQLEPR